MTKLNDIASSIQQSFPYDAFIRCGQAFQGLGEALNNLIALETLEKLAEYDADELAEMHLGVLEAERIINPRHLQ